MSAAHKKTRGSKKNLNRLGIMAIGCAAITAGAYAYWHHYIDLSSKSPKELMHIAIQKSYSFKDNFNFDGEYKVDLQLPKPAYQPQLARDQDKHNTPVMKTENINMTLNLNGAVDFKQQKFEFIPSIDLKDQAFPLKGSLPMQLDLNSMTLVLDPASLRPRINNYLQSYLPKDKINSQYFSLTLPKQNYANLPLKALLKTLPSATTAGYDSLSDQHFTKESITEADSKRFNSTYHIRLKANLAEMDNINKIILKSVQTQLTEQAKQAPADKKQGYDQLVKIFNQLGKVKNQPTKSELNEMKNMLCTSDFYLDKAGRITGMLQEFNFQNSQGEVVKVNGWLKLDYRTQPNFTIQSTPENTYSLEQARKANSLMRSLPN